MEKQLTEHQQKALNYKSHIALTANAGSGKTTVLCERFVKILIEQKLPVKNIAAITFTEKAASELYSKITERIERMEFALKDKIKCEQGKQLCSELKGELKSIKKLRADLIYSNISTIHSFCLEILKDYPIEANIDTQVRPIDEVKSREILDNCIKDVVQEYSEHKEKIKIINFLSRFTKSKKKLLKQLSELAKNSEDIEIFLNSLSGESEKQLYKSIAELINKQEEYLFNELFQEVIEIFLGYTEEIKREYPEDPFVLEVENILPAADYSSRKKFALAIKDICYTDDKGKQKKLFTQKGAFQKRTNWGSIKEDDKEFIERLNLFSDIFEEDYDSLIQINLYLCLLFRDIFSKYEQKKEDESFIDFNDILKKTKKLLENDSIAKSIADKYQYLMIDEYQDTSSIQYEIAKSIVEKSNKSNLFIVGDDKQSIYSFRNADLSIFQQTREDIKEKNPDGDLTLPVNFRSKPEICTFVNETFKKLFSHSTNKLLNEAKREDLVAGVSEKGGRVELFYENSSNGDLSSEKKLIVERIVQLVNEENSPLKDKYGNIRWSEVAILARTHRIISEILPYLVRKGIPFVVTKGGGFYNQFEILDINNYLKFLLDDSDDAALAMLLRSPYFLIEDEKIYKISKGKGNSLFNKLGNYTDSDASIKLVYDRLVNDINSVHTSDPVKLIRKIFNETYYLSNISIYVNANQIKANLEKYIVMLQNYLSMGYSNLYDFVSAVEDRTDDESDKESQADVFGGVNAVILMTIHQAKGLQFPYVFTLFGKMNHKNSSVAESSFLIKKELGFVTKYGADFTLGASHSMYSALFQYLSKKRDLAEYKRLVYVAFTRAISYLGIGVSSSSAKLAELLKISFGDNLFELETDLTVKDDAGEVKASDSASDQTREIKKEFEVKSKIEYGTGKSETIKIEVPIYYTIPEQHLELSEVNKPNYTYLLEKIKGREKGEFFTASKLNKYFNCPKEYMLTYEYGLKEIVESLKESIEDDLTSEPIDTHIEQEDDQERLAATTKGSILHYILQKEIKDNKQISDTIDYLLKGSVQGDVEVDKAEIIKILNDLYNSNTYKELQTYAFQENEFEIVWHVPGDEGYFLWGFIDKLIFDKKNNEIIVIDYKSDNIPESKIKHRTEKYLNQLKFYLYIASKNYKDFEKFSYEIIFIRHPEKPVKSVFTREEIINFENNLKSAITNIRNKNFTTDYKYDYSKCVACSYFINKRCISKD